MASKLEFRGDDGDVTVLVLNDQDVLIGRLFDCAVRTRDSTVTRRHARIDYRDEGYCIDDLGSDNGTWVNGRPITSHLLRPNDTIRCGRFEVRYFEDEGWR